MKAAIADEVCQISDEDALRVEIRQNKAIAGVRVTKEK